MRVYEASGFFKIPKEVIKHLYKKKLISDPLTDNDMGKLSFFRYVWRDKVILKSAISKFSKERRRHMFETINLTKPESYVYTRYKNAKGRLFVTQVVDELNYYYKIPKGVATKIVRRIRKKVYRTKGKERRVKAQ